MNDTIWRIDAAGAADGEGFAVAPASVLVRSARPGGTPNTPWACTVLAVGDPGEINRHPRAAEVSPERRRAFPESVLIPALVNAHSHLDLTHVGPRPYEPSGGFVGWAMSLVRPNRATSLDAARESVREGIRRSLAGGVVAVGDIVAAVPGRAGSGAGGIWNEDARVTLSRELREAFGLGAVGFAEVLGFGPTRNRAADDLGALAIVGCDLQPHAPYSVAPSAYRHAAMLGRRVCTHLAETLDERRFIERGDGPFRDLLTRIGLWDDAAARDVGHGQHPIEHTLDTGLRGFLAAHVNDCPERLIARLRDAQVSVAYCPRAHAYFHHPSTTGPHRYREMLEAGVNVCLGTDSIINLPASQADRISPLDDARLLFERDGVDAGVLLGMITTRGARALGIEPSRFSFSIGSGGAGDGKAEGRRAEKRELAGLLAVDTGGTPESWGPARRVMQSHAAPTLLQFSSSDPSGRVP